MWLNPNLMNYWLSFLYYHFHLLKKQKKYQLACDQVSHKAEICTLDAEVPLNKKAIAKIFHRWMHRTQSAMNDGAGSDGASFCLLAWFVWFWALSAPTQKNRPFESARPKSPNFPSEFENGIPKGSWPNTKKDCLRQAWRNAEPQSWKDGQMGVWLTSSEVRKPIVLDAKECILRVTSSNAKTLEERNNCCCECMENAQVVCLLAKWNDS